MSHSPFRLHHVGRDGVHRILVCWIGCHDRTYYKLLTQLACSDITLSGVRWLSAHNVSVFLLARFQVKSSKIIENGFGFWNTCKVPVIFFFVGFFVHFVRKESIYSQRSNSKKVFFFLLTVWTLITWLLVLLVRKSQLSQRLLMKCSV